MDEQWKPLIEAPNDYAVSNLGRVRRTSTRTRAKAGTILKASKSRDDYRTVGISIPGQNPINRRIHRLVWEAFHGPIPEGLVINHLNGDKTDNRLENLSCVSNSENVAHAFRDLGRRRPSEKLTTGDVVAMREARSAGAKLKDLAERFSITEACVGHVCTGKTWKHAEGPLTRMKAERARTRLSESAVREIVRRHQSGESSVALAQEYGVSDVSVLNWSRGRYRSS